MRPLTKPAKPTAAYEAAQLIYEEGPMQKADLFAKVDFGTSIAIRGSALRRAVDQGWLDVSETGKVDITFAALSHFEQEERSKKEEPTGTVATPRADSVYARKPYVPPARLIRADAPPLYPAGFQFRTIAG